MIKTFGLELHRWRDFGRSEDLFLRYIHLGFMTIFFSRESIIETMSDLRRRIQMALRSNNPTVRMIANGNARGRQ